MQFEVVRLKEFFPALRGNYEPTLTVYCPDNPPKIHPGRVRTAVLVCPGGGYTFTSDREAEPVALQFVAQGFDAFVLRYSVSPERYPESLLEAAAAVSLIRSRAEELAVNPAQIAILGFSAGGHLAASRGVFWNRPELAKKLGKTPDAIRPNALILGYPVITSGPFAHRSSFDELLGPDAAPELLEKMSLEKQVTEQTPPSFLWHTFEDGSVPVENSLEFAMALRRHKVPFELHIYPAGPHGLSLCNYETSSRADQMQPHDAGWMALCAEWLKLIFGIK